MNYLMKRRCVYAPCAKTTDTRSTRCESLGVCLIIYVAMHAQMNSYIQSAVPAFIFSLCACCATLSEHVAPCVAQSEDEQKSSFSHDTTECKMIVEEKAQRQRFHSLTIK